MSSAENFIQHAKHYIPYMSTTKQKSSSFHKKKKKKKKKKSWSTLSVDQAFCES